MTPSAPRPNHATHRSSPEFPSSDPYDETEANPYPTIDSFLLALSSREPRRALLQYIQKFEDADYYNIDQLARCTKEFLTGPKIEMTDGNAEFVLISVGKVAWRSDRSPDLQFAPEAARPKVG
ncbi:hypothetical protein K435DRAFT_880029 [Dendrothele bispora CBS 962.96]|uniref:Uncharacterized protein n=1 Tax=Dendrothele bispora (strain CBS 962.96) TaxID=1314807 RepID=A0A4S8KK48_DENBC|nr:hypothetical protein K435DRAFT_880029 [Dendrothele bispora CBS 962.96]